MVCAVGDVEGARAVLVAFEFGFLGGSLGERTGDRLESAYAHAVTHRLPLVSLVATGGSRMQEGMLALTQLQRVARASARAREAGLPLIAVARDPTTGGGWATLGAGADVVLALPGAQVGFAGSRVRPPGADPTAYTAEAQVAAGAADAVVPPEELRTTLGRWLRLLTRPSSDPAPPPYALGAADLPPPAGTRSAAPAHRTARAPPPIWTRTSPHASRSPATAAAAPTPTACSAVSATTRAVRSPTRRRPARPPVPPATALPPAWSGWPTASASRC